MTNIFHWTGRSDPEDGQHAKRWHDIVKVIENNQRAGLPDLQQSIGLIGFCCDEGVKRNKGRVGAKDAPDVIRSGLANLAWHGQDNCQILDFGNDIFRRVTASAEDHTDSLVSAQQNFGSRLADILNQTRKAIVLGGGHETAAASFDGLYKHLGHSSNKQIGIINLDAHFDIRLPGENGMSSGTPFTQIREQLNAAGQNLHYLCLGVSQTSNTKALFDRASDWGVKYLLDTDINTENMINVKSTIDQFIAECDVLYLTLDLDVLPHYEMPAVSAPSAYGVSITLLDKLIGHIAQTCQQKNVDWCLSDVVEFNPALDTTGNAVKVAARLADKLVKSMIK